ncbi:hypothetical protein Ae331Ps2_2574c [Pseudonocardia sp. Ae331_Ps2]|nr:hypothetical protein Ae331Ps2_2574c [Pseudonocardia sp. Ae331_Ps2]
MNTPGRDHDLGERSAPPDERTANPGARRHHDCLRRTSQRNGISSWGRDRSPTLRGPHLVTVATLGPVSSAGRST